MEGRGGAATHDTIWKGTDRQTLGLKNNGMENPSFSYGRPLNTLRYVEIFGFAISASFTVKLPINLHRHRRHRRSVWSLKTGCLISGAERAKTAYEGRGEGDN